jgi:hypothetical protein
MAFEHSTDANPISGAPPDRDPARAAAARLGTVSNLLSTLENQPQAAAGRLDAAELALENQLVQVRWALPAACSARCR